MQDSAPANAGIRPNGAFLRCPHPVLPRYGGGVVRTVGSYERNLPCFVFYPSNLRILGQSLVPGIPLEAMPEKLLTDYCVVKIFRFWLGKQADLG